MVPKLVVWSLLTDESAYDALEGAVLNDQRVKGDGHTIAKHVEEVVTSCNAKTGSLIAIVVAHGVIEVYVVERQLLHIDLTTFTSLW